MTPFMSQVQALVEGTTPVIGPELVASRPRGVAAGAHRYVGMRALAEQLVAEANAVLGPDHLDLLDGPGLSFVIAYQGRSVAIDTTIDAGVATSHLDGVTLELADAGDVAALLLRFLAHHSVPAQGG